MDRTVKKKTKYLPFDSKKGIESLIVELKVFDELYSSMSLKQSSKSYHFPFDISKQPAIISANSVRSYYGLDQSPIPSLRNFLDFHSCRIFSLFFGESPENIHGLSFHHPTLGCILGIGQHLDPYEFNFSLARLFFLSLTHSVFFLTNTTLFSSEEFAHYFLVPANALERKIHEMDDQGISRTSQVVHLAHCFYLPYERIIERLALHNSHFCDFQAIKDIDLNVIALSLGYIPIAKKTQF
jgi:hypothetical protein